MKERFSFSHGVLRILSILKIFKVLRSRYYLHSETWQKTTLWKHNKRHAYGLTMKFLLGTSRFCIFIVILSFSRRSSSIVNFHTLSKRTSVEETRICCWNTGTPVVVLSSGLKKKSFFGKIPVIWIFA